MLANSSPLSFLELAFSAHLVKRSLLTAVIVGTLLNLINQGDVIWTDKPVSILTLFLTYLVPYCVSTYSGALSSIQAAKVSTAADATDKQEGIIVSAPVE